MANQDYIDALLLERAGYERAGKADRAAQVTEQLRVHGYQDPAPQPVAEAPAAARGRRTTKA